MRLVAIFLTLLWLLPFQSFGADTKKAAVDHSAVKGKEATAEVEGPPLPPKELTADEQEALKIAHAQDQLIGLLSAINSTSIDLATTRKLISKAKDDLEKQQLEKARNTLSDRLEQQNGALESIAIGNLNYKEFQPDSQDDFNWQEDLKDIFRPLLAELRSLTELPRQIEKLRTEKNYLATNIPLAKSALANITKLKEGVKDRELANQLKTMEERWQKKSSDLQSRYDLVSFQLDKLLNPDKTTGSGFFEALGNFFAGRGFNILIATLAFLAVFLTFRVLAARVNALSYRRGREQDTIFIARLSSMVLHVVALIAGILTAVAVLYIQGDWIVLGLVILVLFGLLVGIRNSLPKFMEEARLLLNIGPVRENERVIYEGIPWRVKSMDLTCNLENPALSGGEIRIPLREAYKLQSRKFSKNELWFPCRPGDIIQLDDGNFGPVLLQTPESVQMQVKGGSTKTYATTVFLAQNPRNLSRGFGVSLLFGLDYSLQKSITQEIPNALCGYIQNAIDQDSMREQLLEFQVEFKEVAASSLNLIINAEFGGEAANQYFRIERFLQRKAVDACNQFGWNIPFNQVVVHMRPNSAHEG